MAKLKVVRDRKETNDTIEGDLRGLSNLGVLEVQYPWVFLAVKNISSELLSFIKTEMNLHSKFDVKNEVTIIFDKSRQLDHKIKSVRLMAAAHLINKKQNNTPMMMAQLETLKYKILNIELMGNVESTIEEYRKWDSSKAGLIVCFPLNVYLSQAGFRVDAFGEAVLLSNLDLQNVSKVPAPMNKSKTA